MQFLQQESKQTFPENHKSKKRDYHFQTEVSTKKELLISNRTERDKMDIKCGYPPEMDDTIDIVSVSWDLQVSVSVSASIFHIPT